MSSFLSRIDYGASRTCCKKRSISAVGVKKKLRRLSTVGSSYPSNEEEATCEGVDLIL
jgi:hypothetical protein